MIEQRDLLCGRIKELQSTLERLNYKIEHYDDKLAVREQELFNQSNEKND